MEIQPLVTFSCVKLYSVLWIISFILQLQFVITLSKLLLRVLLVVFNTAIKIMGEVGTQ